MKLERYFTFFLAFFIGLAMVYLFMKNTDKDAGITTEALASEHQKQAAPLSFDTKTTGSLESGDALIELTPAMLGNNRLVVKFSINTHSVSLSSYDLTQLTTLEYGGNKLKPIKATRVGGHHSSGTIVFDTGGDIGSFSIRIKGIPKIEERLYEWNTG
jgi:hypothetical protein